MANELLTPEIIAEEALMQLENNLVLGGLVHKEYKDEFKKVGQKVIIRKPVRLESFEGPVLQSQDVVEGETEITISKQRHVPLSFSSTDLTLKIQDFSERYLVPATKRLAQDVDSDIAARYKDIWNFAGTPGTIPSTFGELGNIAQVLDDMGVPKQDRVGVYNSATGWKLADGLKNTYVQGKAKTAMEEALIGRYARMDNYDSNSIKTHIVGALGGTPLIKGAGQSKTYSDVKATNEQNLVTDGWTNSVVGVVKAGDVFTLAGVFSVNPMTLESTGRLQTFVVKQDADSNGTGEATLVISPAIIITGPYKTVTAAPADNAALTILTGAGGSSHPQNLIFHKNAIALVTVPFDPVDAVFQAQKSYNGLSIRIVKQFDIKNDKNDCRLDILYGIKTIYPDMAGRLTA
jgi:hypothetical protein